MGQVSDLSGWAFGPRSSMKKVGQAEPPVLDALAKQSVQGVFQGCPIQASQESHQMESMTSISDGHLMRYNRIELIGPENRLLVLLKRPSCDVPPACLRFVNRNRDDCPPPQTGRAGSFCKTACLPRAGCSEGTTVTKEDTTGAFARRNARATQRTPPRMNPGVPIQRGCGIERNRLLHVRLIQRSRRTRLLICPDQGSVTVV